MKEWIAKQIIAISETTERSIPRWIRKLIPTKIRNREVEKERWLTESLRSGKLEDEKMPSYLAERLDQTISLNADAPETATKQEPLAFPAWAMAAAAILVVSLTLFMVFPRHTVQEPAGIVETSPVTETITPADVAVQDAPVVRRNPKLVLQSINQDLVLSPLVREQERLASDMTAALQYMADSFLPSEYAERVNENLVTLKQGISGSI